MKGLHLPNKMNFIKYSFIAFIALSVFSSCSNDDNLVPPSEPEVVSNNDDTTNENVDHGESFVLETKTDFFINADGTVNILIKGKYNEGTNPQIISRGIIYKEGTTTPENSDKTVLIFNNEEVNTAIKELSKGKTYTIRGFLKDSKGKYTYSNSITASTDVDATTSRSLKLEFDSNKFSPISLSTFEAEPTIISWIKISKVLKEEPQEYGAEYSIHEDFSDAKVIYIDTTKNFNGTNYIVNNSDNIQTNTKYYVRPIAKYADGTLVKGAVSTVETK
ncbi:hypothetical protein [Tenacibaculum sp. 190524A02b]|uniref:Uncharacterized protein n=1 Tax=Tenacibaculum vairaonense TaxID=3137860 RepID=A0ABP1FEW5_9FLAO